MTTKLGDYYDHFRDIFINGLVIIIIYSKIKDENIRRLYLFSVIVFGFLLCCHFGCQEKNSFNKSNNGCLEIFTRLCYDKENIHNTKHFGNGTFAPSGGRSRRRGEKGGAGSQSTSIDFSNHHGQSCPDHLVFCTGFKPCYL
jgi:hypothetical protein